MMVFSMQLIFVAAAIAAGVRADHTFTFKNNCGPDIQPVIANVNCGYSPRCDQPFSGGSDVPNPAISYTGPQPRVLGHGASQTMTINHQWNGRIFAKDTRCGPKGESCTMTEFNLDTGSQWTPQAYDISNIQGFTQSIQIAVNGGETVICTDVHCPCRQAYPPNDLTGCGNDSPVRGASAGDHSWTITFCP